MKTEYLIFDNSSKRNHIEKISIIFPHICIAILPEALIVKAINLSNLSGLVISSENSDPILESDFESDEESDCLN